MIVQQYRYAGRSEVINSLTSAQVSFATNTLREATYLEAAEVRFPLQLREGLGALYQVVVSDHRYRPPDRLEFFHIDVWQPMMMLASFGLFLIWGLLLAGRPSPERHGARS